jgi:diadenosine tetraphosphate (Ap4A) HIT family hydrolase
LIIFENDKIYIKKEDSQIPWLIVFTKKEYKEISEVPRELQIEVLDILNFIEKEMISYYNPKKINHASFGNYLPRVHYHIMARFEDDEYFPEPMWGKKQRDSNLKLPSFDNFCKIIIEKLS